MLYPAEYVVDNRPGEILYTNVAPIVENSNLDLTSPNNVLYKYNSVEGGIIVLEVVPSLVLTFVVQKSFLSMYLTLQSMQQRVSTPKSKSLQELLYSR